MVVTGLFLRQLSAALLCPLVLVCNRMDRTPYWRGWRFSARWSWNVTITPLNRWSE